MWPKSLLALLLLTSIAAADGPVKALGVETAPIRAEIFSDYQCPACSAFFQEAVKPLIENYVNQGKVYLVHREFPLQGHQYARQAARYATAAASIGRYEDVAAALFEQQAFWSKDGNIERTLAGVLSPAELKKVRQLTQDPRTDAFIQKDVDDGTKAGIRQTPTMILTYRLRTYPLSGGLKYSMLSRLLDSLLNQ